MSNSIAPEEFRQALNESARLLNQNRPGEAVKLLKPLYEQDPTFADVAINLGGAYILQRKWNKAASLLRKAAEQCPENAMVWTNLAAAELGRLETAGPRHQERAIQAYQHALRVDPEAPNVHYHLGLIYKERGELMRATVFFQRALEIRPSDKDASYWLGKLTEIIEQEFQARQQTQTKSPEQTSSDHSSSQSPSEHTPFIDNGEDA